MHRHAFFNKFIENRSRVSIATRLSLTKNIKLIEIEILSPRSAVLAVPLATVNYAIKSFSKVENMLDTGMINSKPILTAVKQRGG